MTNICSGDMCRPGGFEITDRAMSYCPFPRKAKLADIGSGPGATVGYIRKNYGFEIWGVEKDAETVKRAGSEFIIHGDGHKMPFGIEELDGLLFECSLSKMDDPKTVLIEARRVLKPGGYLIISDMYAKGERAELTGLLGRVETKETLFGQLSDSGFSLKLFEDYSPALKRMWGQLIFQYGLDMICENFGTDWDHLKRIKSGYCLIIGQKEDKL